MSKLNLVNDRDKANELELFDNDCIKLFKASEQAFRHRNELQEQIARYKLNKKIIKSLYGDYKKSWSSFMSAYKNYKNTEYKTQHPLELFKYRGKKLSLALMNIEKMAKSTNDKQFEENLNIIKER